MSRNFISFGDLIFPPINTDCGRRIVLDRDLVALDGVLTKRINEAMWRNTDRFPADFCFHLTAKRPFVC